MGFSQEHIKKKLEGVKCPNGECSRVAQETSIKLLGKKSCFIGNTKCQSLDEALKTINNFLIGNGLAVLWVDTGLINPNNILYRAIHFYTVYNRKPLESFSIWESGLSFYDNKQTENEIRNTLNLFKSIDIHHYGKIDGITRFIIWAIRTLKGGK